MRLLKAAIRPLVRAWKRHRRWRLVEFARQSRIVRRDRL